MQEGSVELIVDEGKVSKDLPVFYNPKMELNRSLSILLLNGVEKEQLQIGLPLAGSGVRGLRFIKELDEGKIKHIFLNDHDKDAVQRIKKHFKLNGLNWRSLRRRKLGGITQS